MKQSKTSLLHGLAYASVTKSATIVVWACWASIIQFLFVALPGKKMQSSTDDSTSREPCDRVMQASHLASM